MTTDGFKKYVDNISKTGFCLEFETSQVLKKNGWTVINNKYYMDDQQATVREVDLVAYRARQVQHFLVYTTLIVSCKKSEQNIWALLSKDVDHKDPNIDWRPLHIWSNDKALQYMVSQASFKDKYLEEIATVPTVKAMRTPACHVFAFQEMNRKSGKPQNDRPIFESVTSLMKAQAYELDALHHRKKVPVVYQFNLLSVLDTELLRLHFSEESIDAIQEQDVDYVANYIVSKRETFAKVHFIRRDALASILPDYSCLHEANCNVFDALCDRFYADAVSDSNKVAVFKKDFLKELLWRIRWGLRDGSKGDRTFDDTWLYWKKSPGIISIQVNASEEEIVELNENVDVKKKVGQLFLKYYRYQGPFEFAVDEVPF